MKHGFLWLMVFATEISYCQEKVPPTEEFTISGEVQQEIRIRPDDLGAFKTWAIGDLVITNHLGQKKGDASGLEGILVRDLFTLVKMNAENPKVLSEYYLVFIAADNYKVVFSWNELFNTPTGDNTYLIVKKEGKPLAEMTERILVVSTTDKQTGRRYLKGLSKILIRRAS
jgi:hypothetical protein